MGVKGFTDRDQGWKGLYTEFTTSKGGDEVFIGFLRSSGLYQRRSGGKSAAPMTMAQLGAIHEFGAPKAHIPERSFMRSAVDQNADKIARLSSQLLVKVLDGSMPRKQALGIIGAFVQGLMRRVITGGLSPPLSARRVAEKKSSKPLIDTGQLINSIDWELARPGGRR